MTALTDRDAEQLASLVASATSNELRTLSWVSTSVELRENDVLVREGDESSSIFLVIDGSLSASVSEDDETIELGAIGPGQWIGEVSMLDPGPATATVMAKSNCRLLKLGREEFDVLMRQNSALANRVIRSLCSMLIDRLRTTGKLIFAEDQPAVTASAQTAKAKAWLISAYRQLLGIRGERI